MEKCAHVEQFVPSVIPSRMDISPLVLSRSAVRREPKGSAKHRDEEDQTGPSGFGAGRDIAAEDADQRSCAEAKGKRAGTHKPDQLVILQTASPVPSVGVGVQSCPTPVGHGFPNPRLRV
jgi:hypothetical protein